MKPAQHDEIFAAVRANLQHYVETQGEGLLLNIDHFDEDMFELFSRWFEKEVARLAA